MQQSLYRFCLFSLILVATGCGEHTQSVTIKTDGMRFVAEEIHLKAGRPVTLRVTNQDGYAHTFDLDEFAIHAPLAAQATFDTVFTPTQPGRYRFYCGTPGHAAAGMAGVLVVEP